MKLEITAYEENGDKRWVYPVWFEQKEDRLLIHLGDGFICYNMDDHFMDQMNSSERRRLFIDAGGRNHSGKPVYVHRKDMAELANFGCAIHGRNYRKVRRTCMKIDVKELAEAVLSWDVLNAQCEAMPANRKYPSENFQEQVEQARKEMVRLAKQATRVDR